MCSSILKPDVPAPAAPAPLPPAPEPVAAGSEKAEKSVQTASDAESKRARLAQGRKSTILTGPLGVTDQANVAKKTLLGQ